MEFTDMKKSTRRHLLTSLFMLSMIILPPIVYLNSDSNNKPLSSQVFISSANLTILGPGNKTQPVVNERNMIPLMVMDGSGNKITDVTYSSGSPEVATVDAQSGMVKGVMQGFATITAKRANGDTTSAFVVVARVGSGKGMKVMGTNKTDNTSQAIYLSDPSRNIV